MACTFVTYRARSAVRDVGKALGLSPAMTDHLAEHLDTRDPAKIGQALGVESSEPWEQFLDLCAQIDGFPRHLGIHNGGMIFSASALASRLPTEPATMINRSVVQWDKEGLEQVGLVKFDILGLRMLSALEDAASMLEGTTGERIDLNVLTFDDPAVYETISRVIWRKSQVLLGTHSERLSLGVILWQDRCCPFVEVSRDRGILSKSSAETRSISLS